MHSGRGHWASRVGFVLAAAGSAIGLGNIWKFPYITGEYGGGAFVLVYLGCIAVVGMPIMLAELLLGKLSQRDPVGAFRELEHSRSGWQLVGWLGVASAFVILSFYSVVAGWALAFFARSVMGVIAAGADPAMIGGLFSELYANPTEQIVWHAIFMGVTIAIVSGGVHKGIERWSDILMPALLMMLLGLFIYALTLDAARDGARFLFAADFSKLTPDAVLEALGHSFFTLSLGMGAMITYGSYLGRDANLVRAGTWIVILDTVIALLAGMVIFPIVFQFGMEPGAGPGLIFKTLPLAFIQMTGGQLVACVFFLLLSFAALTSAISLLEVAVAFFHDEVGLDRKVAAGGIGGIIFLLGVPSALYGSFFDFMDQISTNYMLPIGGLGIAIYTGWVLDRARAEGGLGPGVSAGLIAAWLQVLRFVTPVLVLIVFLHKIGVF
ncbi:MAG: sodium-dependent transporter [Candidatus Dadabacteria bacterium]|nr:MAG: sodium-dependent transporter [Candidatus Dadabacteria bacterium]